MARYRPTAVLVLAILHLVGGGVGLAADLGTIVMQEISSNRAVGAPGPYEKVTPQNFGAGLTFYLEEHVPAYHAITFAQIGVNLVLDVLLLIGGVGLLTMRAYGRNVSLVYAVLSILNRLFGIVYGLAVVFPVTNEYLDLVARRNPGMSAAVTAGRVSGVVGMLVGSVLIVYPIVVLIVLLRPRVAAAFRGAGLRPVPTEPADFLDADRPFRPGEPPTDAITR
jgi:hypothetical protein